MLSSVKSSLDTLHTTIKACKDYPNVSISLNEELEYLTNFLECEHGNAEDFCKMLLNFDLVITKPEYAAVKAAAATYRKDFLSPSPSPT